MLASKLLSASGGEDKLFVDDCFAVALYTGNGSTQTINNGIDLAGKGGMVWIKERTALGTGTHLLYYTTQGVSKCLITQGTNPQITQTAPNFGLSAFNSVGFSLADDGSQNTNRNGSNYASWTFRNADKFYNHAVVTKSAGSNATVSFANLGTLGMVRVKRTDSTGSWYIWHRSLSAGQLLIGETTAAAATLGHITVSGTTVTLVNGVIADGTYLVEAFAHDDSAGGIIQCGSYTGTGATNQTINLGWEPQFLLLKTASSSTTDWNIYDSMRGLTNANAATLKANLSNAESASGNDFSPLRATGFEVIGNSSTNFSGQTYIYLAIRRPNKPPTTGTQVYNAIARTGTGAASVTGAGLSPDLLISKKRTAGGVGNTGYAFFSRLTGPKIHLTSAGTSAELTAATDTVISFDMDGVTLGADNYYYVVGKSGEAYINHFFRRAPGVFDIVCYTGTGVARTVPHGLGVAPELMIVKCRSAANNWFVYAGALGAGHVGLMDATDAFYGPTQPHWNSTIPTASVFSLGPTNGVNQSGITHVAYLFASKAGVSKVGNYTGNGGSQTINCGFSTGARFVLIKRVDSTGDWYVWDSARGVVAGNDPHLSLNTTAAEVTTDDSVDPDATGFIVNQVAATNINVNAATYIFLAIA